METGIFFRVSTPISCHCPLYGAERRPNEESLRKRCENFALIITLKCLMLHHHSRKSVRSHEQIKKMLISCINKILSCKNPYPHPAHLPLHFGSHLPLACRSICSVFQNALRHPDGKLCISVTRTAILFIIIIAQTYCTRRGMVKIIRTTVTFPKVAFNWRALCGRPRPYSI